MNRFRLAKWNSHLVYHKVPGARRILVFLHDLGGAGSTDFAALTAEYLHDHERLFLDLLGFGYSDKPPSFGYTIEDHAETVAAFIEESRVINAGPPVFVGMGMGAMLGLKLAATMVPGASAILLEPAFEEADAALAREISLGGTDLGFQQELLHRYPLNKGGHRERALAVSLRQAAPYAMRRGAVSLLEMIRGGRWLELLDQVPETVIFTGKEEAAGQLREVYPRLKGLYVFPEGVAHLLYQEPKRLAEGIQEALSRFGV